MNILNLMMHIINTFVVFLVYCMTSPAHRISFSFTAVAKLAVPPGKWFCLARTGLGFSQYSCCVCGLHHDVFTKHWVSSRTCPSDWKNRLETSIERTLIELDYGRDAETKELRLIRERIMKMITKKDNYFINQTFVDALSAYPRGTFAILTDGPPCLVNMVFPDLPPESLHVKKAATDRDVLSKLSQIHVGSNESDLEYVPQTRFLISRKNFDNLPPNVRLYPRLTPEVLKTILEVT